MLPACLGQSTCSLNCCSLLLPMSLHYCRRLVHEPDAADCWVVNTCAVKSPSQSAMDNLLVKGRASGKALVVAGCVPQGDRRAKQLQGLSVIGERSGIPRGTSA